MLCVGLLVGGEQMGIGKPRGIRAARQLRIRRRDNRWADKSYKKSHSVCDESAARRSTQPLPPTNPIAHSVGVMM